MGSRVAAFFLLGSLWAPGALAAPNEDRIEADILRGLTEVCIPAQVREQSAKAYIGDSDREFGLRRRKISNKGKTETWALSTDERVFILSQPDICVVSVDMQTDLTSGFVETLHSQLSKLSASVPSTLGTPGSDRFVGGYCALLSGGKAASFQLQAHRRQDEAEIGRIAPRERDVVSLAVPRVSGCRAK